MGQSLLLSTLQPAKESRGKRAPPCTTPGDSLPGGPADLEGCVLADGGRTREEAERRDGQEDKRDGGVQR